jgi:hypothetical protein
MEPANPPWGDAAIAKKAAIEKNKNYDWGELLLFFSAARVQYSKRQMVKWARWRQGLAKRWDERWDEAD